MLAEQTEPIGEVAAGVPADGSARHQYVRRCDGSVVDEEPFGDRFVRFLYATSRATAPRLVDLVAGPRLSRWLAFLHYDLPLAAHLVGDPAFLERCGVDPRECFDPPATFDTPRRIFERRIRYWHCRPMPDDENLLVAAADARLLVGSLAPCSPLFLGGRFFDLEELLAIEKLEWHDAFAGADAALFRLGPDGYHYSHVPASGIVVDRYDLDGAFHACSPGAIVEVGMPYSMNRRSVTILDTDIPGGSAVGLVAVVEVVALMGSDVVPCYSETLYDDPLPVHRGMFLERGAPKSLFRPGSGATIVLFQRGRTRFQDDLVANRFHPTAASCFSRAFAAPMVETDVRVRSPIAERI